MKIKKDNILIALQTRIPLSYETIQKVYEITKSYDAILKLNELSIKYNKNIIEIALFLYQ